MPAALPRRVLQGSAKPPKGKGWGIGGGWQGNEEVLAGSGRQAAHISVRARIVPARMLQAPDMHTRFKEFLVIPRAFLFPPRVVSSRISPAGSLRTNPIRQKYTMSEATPNLAPDVVAPNQASHNAFFVMLIRSIVPIIATLLFSGAFWWPGMGWRDGTPPILHFVLSFHLPLAVGLVCGSALLRQSGLGWKLIGFVCVAVCGCGLIEILVNSVILGSGIKFYSRS